MKRFEPLDLPYVWACLLTLLEAMPPRRLATVIEKAQEQRDMMQEELAKKVGVPVTELLE